MQTMTNTVRDTRRGGYDYSAPAAGLSAGRLEFHRGASHVEIRGGAGMIDLFRAHFEGPEPIVDVVAGTVDIRYPYLNPFDWVRNPFGFEAHGADIVLNSAVAWGLCVRGGVSRLEADLTGVVVTGVEIRGGASRVDLVLDRPQGIVPIRVRGGASHVTIWRPAGVATRVAVGGGASRLTLDDQRFGSIGGRTELTTCGWREAEAGYEVEIGGGASHVSGASR